MKFSSNVKRIFLFLPALVIMPGLFLFPAGTMKGETIKKGAEQIKIKGHLRDWKDIKKVSLNELRRARKLRPVLNFERPRHITRKGTGRDRVVQTSFGGKTSLERKRSAAITSADFAGMNLAANGSGWPPDPVGDVGITYYVQAVNTSLGIYRKSDGELVSAVTFDDFFGGEGISGTPCDENN
ncbi:MAG: hypothetical protein GY771_03855, partial [bacterium]|nr:hypothetical protein [bacterium]